jgi:hypothetical protein
MITIAAPFALHFGTPVAAYGVTARNPCKNNHFSTKRKFRQETAKDPPAPLPAKPPIKKRPAPFPVPAVTRRLWYYSGFIFGPLFSLRPISS